MDRIHLVENVPPDPGVYLMKDAQGAVIYVGKARNLRKRVGAYLRNSGHSDKKTGVLVGKIAAIDTIVTKTEKEALILESNLIKKHRPRYNVVLKDDKRYPSLRLDLSEKYPGFRIVRRIGRDDAMYFGPFASAHAVRETLKTINKTFKLRKCKTGEFKTRNRPCLHCQMNGCLAPCCRDVPPAVYHDQVQEAILFLKGRTKDLIGKIRREMETAAAAQEFERAARLRDKIISLEKTVEKQIAVTTDFRDRDVIGLARSDEQVVLTVMAARGGRLLGSRHYHFSEPLANEAEILGAFIRQLYERAPQIPEEILVPEEPSDADFVRERLRAMKGKTVRLIRPKRGEKAQLLRIARQNAEQELNALTARRSEGETLLARLQQRLNGRRLPNRIECCDNSNLAGTEPVASIVVFEGAVPLKSDYRKYRIKGVAEHDDYAYMREVLQRRLKKVSGAMPLPDLLLVDGGKGQLNIASAVARELNVAAVIDIAAIAKKDEKRGETRDKVFIPGRSNPLQFGPRDADLLLFLQRVRDEAHRFAITYQRQRRSRAAIRSALDRIPGIGKKRKAVLLKHYQSIAGIRQAGLEEMSRLPGMNRRVAEAVKDRLSTPRGAASGGVHHPASDPPAGGAENPDQ
jgi:excinuclease ABC subunit C